MRNRDGSWDAYDDDVLDFALDRIRAGERVALVTLVKIEGSSPRSLGAQMAVAETGQWVGYLSGGCIERAVAAEAVSAIEAGGSRRVRYGRGSPYMDIQLPCGSALELVFDVDVSLEQLAAIDAKLRMRLPATIDVPPVGEESGVRLVRRYQPRRRLLVAGAGPAAAELARLGHGTGFEVVAYSPDRTTIERLSMLGVESVSINGAADAPNMSADSRTAIVLMFHDHEWEKALLPAALATDAFYIGALGGRTTHRTRMRQLTRMGFGRAQLGRIRGPAGLFGGGRNAADIALSILAEISQIERHLEQRHPALETLTDRDDLAFAWRDDVSPSEAPRLAI